MRIAVDFRVLSTEAANRGMGRYTQQQLREVLKLDHDNEYLLLCYPYVKKSLIYPEILSASNIRIIQLPFQEINNPYLNLPLEQTHSFSARFQDFLYKERVDLFHGTTPFLNPIVSDFDVCPLICTLFDLIPLIYPQQYLVSPPGLDQQYSMALQFLRTSRRLISISKSARYDAYCYLGYDQDRVDVAYPVVDPLFQVLPLDRVQRTLDKLSQRTPVPQQYILSVIGVHYSKNAATLFKAYGMLPTSLQEQLPLFVVLPSEWAYQVCNDTYGNIPNVILTHSVTDNELAALYNAATMLVHPSRYEGFGYPVVEAMKCGAPVITTTTSSLPEVGGEAAILFDPETPDALCDAIEMLFYDPQRRQEMRERGFLEVEKFSLEQLGQNTYESYLKALISPPQVVSEKRRHVAIWSSFPPLNCGVADYTAELVEWLAHSCNIEVFVDGDYLPDGHLSPRFRIHHFSAFERRDRQDPFDVVIYQMGSTLYQDFMYDMVRQRPGIVVFHDLLMGLGFFSIYSERKQRAKFRKKVLEPEGEQTVRAFDRVMRGAKETPIQELDVLFRKHYLLRWIVDNSLAQIVHMQEAKKDLESRYVNINAHVIQMGVADPWAGRTVNSPKPVRIRYGISPSTFVVGILGSVVAVKRIEACLYALKELASRFPDTILLLVGNQPISQYTAHLNHLINQLELQRFVRFTGHVSREDFDNLFLSCDVILNLRYPTYKGMSAILVRALAAGKPVIVTDVPEWSDFPPDFCWRVKPDETEVATLASHLITLAGDPELLKQASMKARRYFEQYGTLSRMASQYQQCIEQVASRKQTRTAEAEIVSK